MPHLQARQHPRRSCQHHAGARPYNRNVQRVPAEICENCGEVYHDVTVTRSLLQQADIAAQRGVEIDVRRYAAA
jgi:hypothetical protein